MSRRQARPSVRTDPSWPDLDAHRRLVEQLPARITAAVAAGAITPDEAEQVLSSAAEVLEARRSADGDGGRIGAETA